MRNVVLGVGVAAVLGIASVAGATTPLTIGARRVGPVAFRTPLASTVRTLDGMLGRRARVTATPFLARCGVTASATWGSLVAYFDHARLVGVSAGPRPSPSVRTDTGLVLGETMAQATTRLGRHLTLSTAQGGTFVVSTPQGPERGFLTPSDGHPNRRSRVATLDVGNVGCPALSP